MSRNYFTNSRFQKYLPDWIVVGVLILIFFGYTESLHPFYRQFSINDPKISYPFARVEQVTDNQLYLYSTIIPTIIITIVVSLNNLNHNDKLHLLQISLLGLWFSVCSVSVLTDLLRVAIGNPRPDFLQRCGPKEGTPINQLVDVSICTAPLGQIYLMDGMKSTPSGHSSMSFAGLLYLTIWLIGQFKIIQTYNRHNKIIYIIFVNLPILLACYIAFSRTQDYRHHFFDILFGSCLGILFATISYFKYFNSLLKENSNEPIEYN
ncbi:unnamed protein product [Candida verbasci]|uniref:Phosphatidic acid phosphatase type 2/haloperoxidase domain-containing protein n=1 Tax=Candida verbasci TaxID=1227364 RepID=A0A9W4TSH3_9ASCO|nr:unnamed protein product [Candida verbasci]